MSLNVLKQYPQVINMDTGVGVGRRQQGGNEHPGSKFKKAKGGPEDGGFCPVSE